MMLGEGEKNQRRERVFNQFTDHFLGLGRREEKVVLK